MCRDSRAGDPKAFVLHPISVALAITVLVGWGTAHAAESAEDFYRGKQIRLIVSTDAGGAYDAYARLVASVLKDHIPGNPTVIVQNMPGASGLKTANYMFAAAPRDGTVIAGTHSSVLTAPLTSPGAAVFDANKLSWIGSVTSDPYIGYVWHTAPIKSLEDARTTEVIMGGVSVGRRASILPGQGDVGPKLKIVTGYKASNDVKLADGTRRSAGHFRERLEQRPECRTRMAAGQEDFELSSQTDLKKHPELPDVPSIFEFARNDADHQALVFMLARQEAAKPYFAPPAVRADRLAVLRRAFDATVRDPNLLRLPPRPAWRSSSR